MGKMGVRHMGEMGCLGGEIKYLSAVLVLAPRSRARAKGCVKLAKGSIDEISGDEGGKEEVSLGCEASECVDAELEGRR